MKDVRMRGGEDVRMRMDVDEDGVALTRTRKGRGSEMTC